MQKDLSYGYTGPGLTMRELCILILITFSPAMTQGKAMIRVALELFMFLMLVTSLGPQAEDDHLLSLCICQISVYLMASHSF